MKNPQYSAETRAHRLAEILVAPEHSVHPKDGPLRELLAKSFAERVLWLETQLREQLDALIEEYDQCKQ